jgi:hypothetical protein
MRGRPSAIGCEQQQPPSSEVFLEMQSGHAKNTVGGTAHAANAHRRCAQRVTGKMGRGKGKKEKQGIMEEGIFDQRGQGEGDVGPKKIEGWAGEQVAKA